MVEYVYPSVFHANDDGTYTVMFPDLPGCISEGKTLGNAMYMAQAALTQWLGYMAEQSEAIPPASDMQSIPLDAGEFASLIRVEIKDNRAVRRTVSIPKWMDEQVSKTGLSLSRVLQDALAERLSAQ